MRPGKPFREELDSLRAELKPQARGRALEQLVGRLFRAAHYRVELDPGIASPRQTDLIAESGGATYVIEAKSRKAQATVNDVDGLRSRLERARSGITGILVSTSGFSATAIAAVEARRDRPVLLIDGEDLDRLCDGDADLRGVIGAKRDALVLHGEALLSSRPSAAHRRRSKALNAMIATADRYIVGADGVRWRWATGHGSCGDLTFIGEHHDPDWAAAGVGVTVDLRLPLWDALNVRGVLAELSSLGWITGAGQWCISQAERNWHGVAAETWVEALDGWQERYVDAGAVHHTEQARYHDLCEDGFYTLSLDVSASEPRSIHSAEMSLQLAGIPLDLDPIRELCRTLDVESHVAFRPRNSEVFERTRAIDPTDLEIVASIVEERRFDPLDRLWACGIIARNPYYGADGADGLPDHLRPPLSKSELLVCELGSWHPHGETHRYELRHWEWASTSGGLVVRVTADWLDRRDERAGDPPRSRDSAPRDRRSVA